MRICRPGPLHLAHHRQLEVHHRQQGDRAVRRRRDPGNAKSESAALKLTKAQNYLRKLLINTGSDKRASYNMGGTHKRVDHLAVRPYAGVAGIDYIPS